jgi:hypothetical protein
MEHVQKIKKAPEESRTPFQAAEVPRLWKAAEDQKDNILADLIRLDAPPLRNFSGPLRAVSVSAMPFQ